MNTPDDFLVRVHAYAATEAHHGCGICEARLANLLAAATANTDRPNPASWVMTAARAVATHCETSLSHTAVDSIATAVRHLAGEATTTETVKAAFVAWQQHGGSGSDCDLAAVYVGEAASADTLTEVAVAAAAIITMARNDDDPVGFITASLTV